MSDDLVKRLRDKLRDRKTRFKESFEAADRIEELEADLARAVRALKFIGCDDSPEGKHARTTLAELTGGKHDRNP